MPAAAEPPTPPAADRAGPPPAGGLDGPTLRAVRESVQVPLRRIARQAGMSHGHLSKVERGEHGRPVTPAILAAYQKVTGVDLVEAATAVAERRDRDTGARGHPWRPGQLTDLRRQSYNAAIGAIGLGGALGEPMMRLIDSTGRPVTPTPPEEGDADQLEQLVGVLVGLDLAHGGGMVSQAAKAVLRWAVVMLDAARLDPATGRRLAAATAALAHRAGWAAYDVAAHEAARSLFRLALHTATRADDPDLRGHVLADVAAQHNQLGYHHDALAILRGAEGDERITPPVRLLLHTVKARTYATLADAAACHRQLDHADAIHAIQTAHPAPPAGWVATLLHPGHHHAGTGHALATLADHTGNPTDTREAQRRLTTALEAFDPATHTRARTLAAIRLATLQLADDPEQATHTTRAALQTAARLRSARVAHSLATLQTAAGQHPDQPVAQTLASEINAAIGATDEPAPALQTAP